MYQLRVLGTACLVDEFGAQVPLLGSQPKLLALLTFLALADPGVPPRRDTLLNLFWPDLPESGARHALSQARSVIRRALGDDAIIGKWNEAVRVNPDMISCDVSSFRAHLQHGEAARALTLYKGPLLDGFHLMGSPDFDRWMDHQRDELARLVGGAATALAEEAARAGNAADTAVWARRAIEIHAFDEIPWRLLIEAQQRAGDRAGALATFERLQTFLDKELGVEPHPATLALAKTISADKSVYISPVVNVDAQAPLPQRIAAPSAPQTGVTSPQPDVARSPGSRVAAAAAAGLTAVVITALIFTNGRHPAPSRNAVAADTRPRILALPFEAEPRDSQLARAATLALHVDLAQSRAATFLSDAQIAVALRRMRLESSTALSGALARELAVREGAAAVITGSIARVGKGFLLVARATRANDGAEIAAHSITVDSTSIIAGIETLSRRVRAALGESTSELAAGLPLAYVTTSSLEALQAYSAARNAQGADAVLALLEQALDHDSTFAMAYLQEAARVYAPWGPDSKRREALARAWELRDRLPEPERSYAVAAHYRVIERHSEKALAVMLGVLARDSMDEEATNVVTDIYMRRHDFNEAWRYASRVLNGGDNGPAMYNAFVIAVARGDFHNAEAVLRKMGGDSPAPFDHRLRGELAAARRDYADAMNHFEVYRQTTAHGTLDHSGAYGMMIVAAAAAGDLEQATDYVLQDMRENASLGASMLLERSITLARLMVRKGQAAHADAVLDSMLEQHPLGGLPPADRPYTQLANYYIQRGDTLRGRRYLDQLGPNAASENPAMLEARGQFLQAAARYRELTQSATAECLTCGMYDLARMYDLAGQPDSAVSIYRRAIETTGSRTVRADAASLQTSLQRLIQLEVQKGDTTSAVAHAVLFRKLYGRGSR